MVRAEKRAMSIICPGLPYQETIELVNIVPIYCKFHHGAM